MDIFCWCNLEWSAQTSMVSLPSLTAVSRRGSMVSRPGNPGGGVDRELSSTACGAASVNMDTKAWELVLD